MTMTDDALREKARAWLHAYEDEGGVSMVMKEDIDSLAALLAATVAEAGQELAAARERIARLERACHHAKWLVKALRANSIGAAGTDIATSLRLAEEAIQDAAREETKAHRWEPDDEIGHCSVCGVRRSHKNEMGVCKP